MNQQQKDQLRMYSNSIHKYDTFEDLEQYILNRENGIETFEAIKIDLEDYYNTYGRKTKYWMLISNPRLWGDTEEFEVNELLYNLNDNNIQYWKINDRTSMDKAMRVGDLGIIKVSDDKRTKSSRLDDNGEEVPLLEAGIYAIFEVVKDKDEDTTWESEYGNFYVNIKVINNLFANGKNISKENSIKLLGENLYKSIPSTKIDKSIFDKVISYIDNNKC
jgi:hypothetical protein